jgi:TonB-dependent receptor
MKQWSYLQRDRSNSSFGEKLCWIAVILLACSSRVTLAQSHLFDIESQPLASALIKFSEQAGIVVVAPSALIESEQSTGIKGIYSRQEALRLLLEHSNVVYRFINNQNVIIEAKDRLGAALNSVTVNATGEEEGREVGLQPVSIIEEVEVRSHFLNVKRSLEMKRNYVQFVDGVSADDIAGFPDQNLAESLQRVPGVQMTRDPNSGRGSSVSVRGLRPEFAQVTLGGQSLLSPTFGGGFSFDIFQPEIASGIQVIKSPSADMDEGGLAGTINVDTISPLALNKKKLDISGKGIYSQAIDELSPKLNIAYVNQFMDKRLGIVLNMGRQEIDARYDTVFIQNYSEFNGSALDENREGLTPDIGDDGYAIEYPRRHRYRRNDMAAKQRFFNATVEFIINDAWETQLKLNAVNEDIVQDHSQILLMLGETPITQISRTGSQVDYFSVSDHRLEINRTQLDLQKKTGAFTWDVDWQRGQWQVGATLHYSRSEYTYLEHAAVLARDDVDTVIDYRDRDHPLVSMAVDPADPNTFAEQLLSRRSYPVRKNIYEKNAESAIQWDVSRKLNDLLYVSTMKMGVKFRHQTMSNNEFSTNNGVFEGSDILDPVNPLPELADAYELIENFGNGEAIGLITRWAVPDLEAFEQTFNQAGFSFSYSPSDNFYYRFKRDITSAYLMLDLEQGGLRGNVGVRYIHTDRIMTVAQQAFDFIPLPDGSIYPGEKATTYLTPASQYDEWLPSISLAYDLTEDIVLRASAARVMVRPEAVVGSGSYSTRVEFKENEVANGVHVFEVRSGSVDLKPMTAGQFDLGVEWYYRKASAVSLGYFYKDVNNQTRRDILCPASFSNLISGLSQVNGECLDPGGNVWEITRVYNADKKLRISGVEFSLTHLFNRWPSVWRGLGIQANYTYIDAVAQEQEIALEDTANKTANFIVFYERNNVALRVTYNYRGEYYYKGFFASNGRMVDARKQIDVSVSYKISEHLQLSLEGINVNSETDTAYYHHPQQFQGLGVGHTTYQVGVKYQL